MKKKGRRRYQDLVRIEEEKYKYRQGFAKVDVVFLEFGKYLTQAAKIVFVTLKSFSHGDDIVFPSLTTIEHRSGLSRPTVSEAINELEEFHWVTKLTPDDPRFDPDIPNNQYELNTPVWRIDGVRHFCQTPTKEQAVARKKAKKEARFKYQNWDIWAAIHNARKRRIGTPRY